MRHNHAVRKAPLVLALTLALAGAPAAAARPPAACTASSWFAGTTNPTMDALVAKAVRLQGSFSHTWPMWERCLQLLAAGTIQLAPIVSDDLPLSRWQDGYARSESRQAVKVIFRPHAES